MVHVREYHRGDGTRVRAHERRAPTAAGGGLGAFLLLLLIWALSSGHITVDAPKSTVPPPHGPTAAPVQQHHPHGD
ncbi:hypothetical protein [Wenjunlia tyrosinilytica]|uniref:hypothetical protein n=1 Tax=Wenjunlia tyrosinilytica TaxID=1544741 RepID=UPI0016630018|nr:hypothetical protein [Wenjunlia tyrosinilytica]